MNRKEIPRELAPILHAVFSKGFIDGISIAAMMRRWDEFESQLPAFSAITPDQHALATELAASHRDKVKALGLSDLQGSGTK